MNYKIVSVFSLAVIVGLIPNAIDFAIIKTFCYFVGTISGFTVAIIVLERSNLRT